MTTILIIVIERDVLIVSENEKVSITLVINIPNLGNSSRRQEVFDLYFFDNSIFLDCDYYNRFAILRYGIRSENARFFVHFNYNENHKLVILTTLTVF